MIKRVDVYDVTERTDTWTLEGILTGLSVLWGPAGVGKSFLAIAWSVCVATGKAWLGHTAVQGRVVYIVGEGGTVNVARRIREAARDLGVVIPRGSFSLIPTAVPLSTDVDLEELGLVAALDEAQPTLVVVDTLSRCMPGDENKQEDMQKFVAVCDHIRERWGCTVLVVHHANREGTIRGSSVLPAAADVVFRVYRRRDGISLRPDKIKDLDCEHFEPGLLDSVVVDCRDVDHELVLDMFGAKVTTLVLRAKDGRDVESVVTARGSFAILEAGRSPGKCVGWKEWVAQSGLADRTMRRAVATLLEAGEVVKVSRGQYLRPGMVPTEYGEGHWEDHDEIMDREARGLEALRDVEEESL